MGSELTTQLRSKVRGHVRGIVLRPGQTYWASLDDAHHDVAYGLAELAVKPQPVPAAEPIEKKVLQHAPSWPQDRFSYVQRAWEGDTVVCIATGPSLTEEQVARTKGPRRDAGGRRVRVAVVNDAYQRAPWADLHYFADHKWWDWHKGKAEFQAFQGERCTIWGTGNQIDDARIHFLRNAGGDGISTKPGMISTGTHSGHQIINIVALAGVSTILLLGYDARRGAQGEHHYFGQHPDKTEAPYAHMRQSARSAAPVLKALGIRVVNCTPGSAIDAFERGTLESLLPDS